MHSHTLEANKLKPLLIFYSFDNLYYTSVLHFGLKYVRES